MDTTTIRLSCWLISMSLTFAGSFFGYESYKDLKTVQLPLDSYVRGVLADTLSVLPTEVACIARPQAERAWLTHNWTGIEVDPADPGQPQLPGEPMFVSVRSMLRIHMLQVDGAPGAAGSCIYVHYLDSSVAPDAPRRLRVGDALPAPFAGASVVSITEQGVEFAHAGFPDGNEILHTGDKDSVPLIFVVGPGGGRMPFPLRHSDGRLPTILHPKQTQKLGTDHYRVGTEDADHLADNYPEILTRDLRYRPYRDPGTGKRRGIEIQEVRTGSLAERHGLRGGDIILSVNDHPVTGVQGAISYFKTNSDRFTTWAVVVENLGRRRTVTYESPSP